MHVGEVFVAHTDYNDRAGHVGQVYQQSFRLRHVVDLAICQDQHHVVAGSARLAHAVLLESLEAGRELSWTTEQDLHQSLVVGLHDALDAGHIRLLGAPGQGEAMAYYFGTHEFWLTPEAEHGELLVGVVGFEHCADLVDGRLVLVLTGAAGPVQTVRVVRIVVRTRVIDSDGHPHLPPTSEIVHKGGRCLLSNDLLHCFCAQDDTPLAL